MATPPENFRARFTALSLVWRVAVAAEDRPAESVAMRRIDGVLDAYLAHKAQQR